MEGNIKDISFFKSVIDTATCHDGLEKGGKAVLFFVQQECKSMYRYIVYV